MRLDDGRYLPIALERIQRIANTLVELFDRDGLNAEEALSLPRSQGGRLAQLAIELNGPTLSSDDARLAALAFALGEMAEALLLASQRVMPSRLEQLGHRFAQRELSSALASVLAER